MLVGESQTCPLVERYRTFNQTDFIEIFTSGNRPNAVCTRAGFEPRNIALGKP